MILLDTHVLLWLANGDQRLGPESRAAADLAVRANELTVSAFSFWEAAMLVEKRRLLLDRLLDELRDHVIQIGIREVAVSGAMGILAARLNGLHGDPADRIIAATAMTLDATLVTADRSLLAWRGGLKTQDARL